MQYLKAILAAISLVAKLFTGLRDFYSWISNKIYSFKREKQINEAIENAKTSKDTTDLESCNPRKL